MTDGAAPSTHADSALPPLTLGPAEGARIAVVGGAGGIGRRLVVRLMEAGAVVTVIDLPGSLEVHPPPDGVTAIGCDATREGEVAGAFGRITGGALDGLVNLCGFAEARTPVAETDPADWDSVIAGNLRAAYLVSRAAVPMLRKGRDPSMVQMASGIAQLGTPGYGPYGAAKAGVINLTRTLAQELAPSVRVNAVAPAAVDTAFLRGGTHRGGRDDGPPTRLDVDAYVARVPLGRLAMPDDVVGPILFLLGPASAYLTGQTLYINGGTWFA
jgi:3-oxoacyl-[acyl-carrier protein] reductase